MILWVLWLLGVAQAACPLGSQLDDAVPRAVRGADDAIAALDTDALTTAIAAIDAAVRCQPQALTPADAAAVHRVSGIAAFVSGDETAASTWFAAARSVDPVSTLGHDIGGPLNAAWGRATASSAPAQRPLRAPLDGELLVDGSPQETAPAYLPFVLQQRVDDRIQAGWLQLPGAPLPNYPGRPLPNERARNYGIAAGSSAALATVALTAAASTRRRFNDPSAPYSDVEGLIRTNHALGVTGASLVVVGLGFGAAAFVQADL